MSNCSTSQLEKSYIHTMQQLVTSSLGPPEKYAKSTCSIVQYNTQFKSCYCRDGDIPRAVIHKALKYAEELKCMLLCVLCTKLDNLIQIQLRILAAQPIKSLYEASMNICKTVKETSLPENPWPLTNPIIVSSIH